MKFGPTRAWVPRLEGPNLTLAPAQVGVTRSPGIDPELSFEIGPMNGRYAAECGRRWRATVAAFVGEEIEVAKIIEITKPDRRQSRHPANVG
jgi:hypothetical protein